MSEQFIQVTTTTASAEEAREIARVLVEGRLAGCVQIVGPIESVYRWQGKIESAGEWQCLAKTSMAKYTAVEAAIVKTHSYETPEIIATPIVDSSEAYLSWLRDALA
jgi:periplasmic divalent cation tolerance protein